MGIGDKELTLERLRERVNYNPETGVMTLKTRPIKGGNTAVGDVLGSPHSAGYIQLRLDGRPYLLHRLAWFYMHGEWPVNIDHINHNRQDNRLVNLRSVSRAENQKNQKKRVDNLSGLTGVRWCNSRQKWVAHIRENNRYQVLGRFNNLFDAACARKSMENYLHFHINHGSAFA